MRNVESELKRVRSQSKGKKAEVPRDPTMTGGERAETPSEKRKRHEERRKPKEPPIIEKTVD